MTLNENVSWSVRLVFNSMRGARQHFDRRYQTRQMTHTLDMLFILASFTWPKRWIPFHCPPTTPSASSTVIYGIVQGFSLGRLATQIMILVHLRLQNPRALTRIAKNPRTWPLLSQASASMTLESPLPYLSLALTPFCSIVIIWIITQIP